MSATVTQIRAAVTAMLTAHYGTNEQVSQYMLADSTPPTFDVVFNGIPEYDLAMRRGSDRYEFIVRIVVGLVTDQGSQIQLDSYLDSTGTGSVKALIETRDAQGRRSLGGVVEDAYVRALSAYKQYDRPNGAQLGVEWTIEVMV